MVHGAVVVSTSYYSRPYVLSKSSKANVAQWPVCCVNAWVGLFSGSVEEPVQFMCGSGGANSVGERPLDSVMVVLKLLLVSHGLLTYTRQLFWLSGVSGFAAALLFSLMS